MDQLLNFFVITIFLCHKKLLIRDREESISLVEVTAWKKEEEKNKNLGIHNERENISIYLEIEKSPLA